MANLSKYNFIAIEGNIGAGKTTFSSMISNDFNCKLILEAFSDNPFLPLFYQNPERYSFPVELFFMTERHKQLQENLLKGDLFQQTIIADYFFIKTLLFARRNLKEDEYRLFQRIYHVLNATFPKPDLLVYLHRPIEVLQKNIKNRGRDYEQQITTEYLNSVQQGYFDYFKTEMDFPILIVNVGDMDFIKDKNYYQELVMLLQADYKLGMNYVHIQ